MTRLKILLTILIIVIVSTSLPHTTYAKRHTKEQFIKMGGQSMSGTVLKAGAYNFIIHTVDGEEVNIHTDSKKIQFFPEDERLMVGDKISFIYLAPESASGSINKRFAYYVEFTERVPRNFLTEELTCVIASSGRNEKACYFPENKKLVSLEGHWPEKLGNTSVGSEIKVKLKVVPANIGNGYIYKIKSAKSN